MDVGMRVPLGLVERLPTGEDDIAPSVSSAASCCFQRGRCVLERAQFIHAVEHDDLRAEMVGEGESHRCVVPERVRSRSPASR